MAEAATERPAVAAPRRKLRRSTLKVSAGLSVLVILLSPKRLTARAGSSQRISAIGQQGDIRTADDAKLLAHPKFDFEPIPD